MSDDPLKPFVDGLKAETWDDIPTDSPPPSVATEKDLWVSDATPEDVQDDVHNVMPEPESFKDWGDPNVTIKLPDYCVEGLLPVGGKMVLGGGSKSYKTWQLIDLGLSVAHGVPWMGLPTRKSKVLYIDLEFIPPFFKKRVRGVAEAKGLGVTDNFHVWHLRSIEYNPMVLLQVMRSWPYFKDYSMIIVDPFYKMNAGGDENANGEVTDLLLKLEKFADTASLVFAHHFAKGDMTSRDPIDRCSGAGSFARDPDAVLSCTRHEVDRCLTVDLSIRNDKPIKSFVVRFDSDKLCMVQESDLDPDKLHKPGQPYKTMDEVTAVKDMESLASLCEPVPHSREVLQSVATGAGWSRREFDQALLDKEELGKWFIYETRGRSSVYTPK
jgi:hypothetical protein